jgi:hypothetical protein
MAVFPCPIPMMTFAFFFTWRVGALPPKKQKSRGEKEEDGATIESEAGGDLGCGDDGGVGIGDLDPFGGGYTAAEYCGVAGDAGELVFAACLAFRKAQGGAFVVGYGSSLAAFGGGAVFGDSSGRVDYQP